MTLFSKMFLPSRLLPFVVRKAGCCQMKSITSALASTNIHNATSSLFSTSLRSFSVTSQKYDLMEFFEQKDNWGEKEVRVGRSWKADELRLKSNTDLHKLWYVLLKERNMLKTMEHDAREECRLFPNPERIDKVEESMKNLEEVVRERNKAYFLLETGTTGERSGEEFENWLGLPEYRQFEEFPVPPEQNRQWHIAQKNIPTSSDKEKRMFYSMLRQSQRKHEWRLRRFYDSQVKEILRTFPNVDLEALSAKFPEVPMESITKYKEEINERVNENVDVPWRIHRYKGLSHTRYTSSWKKKFGQ